MSGSLGAAGGQPLSRNPQVESHAAVTEFTSPAAGEYVVHDRWAGDSEIGELWQCGFALPSALKQNRRWKRLSERRRCLSSR
jgi:hypothetical protein